MSPDPSPDNGNMPPDDTPSEQPPTWGASYAPKLAVLAVAGAAVAAVFMGTRPETPAPVAASPVTPPRQAVVQAPPLVVTAPPLEQEEPSARASRGGGNDVDARSAMGASPGCERCGVVESVRTAEPGQNFQMRIRMDDGSVRTLEQRGALAAGTRVVVEGGAIRLMPG